MNDALYIAATGMQMQQLNIERAKRLDKTALSARYAESILNGEIHDKHGMQRLAQRILGERNGPIGGSMADWLTKTQQ